MIFLAGPPGAGKTSLGARVCALLELVFLDFSPGPGAANSKLDRSNDIQPLKQVIESQQADLVALSWAMQLAPGTMKLARRSGTLIGLWAHPEEMQARSGHPGRLFTPAPGLTTRGGFGRTGTRCPEFRRLDRACNSTLMLQDVSLDEAAADLKALILKARSARSSGSSAVEAGAKEWAKRWREEHCVTGSASALLADAVFRYRAQLIAKGVSPRSLSGIMSDLDLYGGFLFGYESPTGHDILNQLGSKFEYEFSRKVSNSPGLVSRYRRTVEGFFRFLEQAGLRSP